MYKRTIAIATLLCATLSYGQNLKPIELKKPDMTRKTTLMNALSKRMSSRAFSPKMISVQELSDLLWAANGINRPDGKRTAPSARNAQDIDVYVLTAEGAYLYNPTKNLLEPVAAGDFRGQIWAQQEFVAAAPVNIMLISDLSRFTSGDDAQKASFAAMDAGIVSQNISLFCAAAGLATVPRGLIDAQKMTEVLKLKESQRVILNHPVGYPK
ncbi:MAG: SagB/ThcOx family dehydrogenase [Chitinispirillales bacterium]|jgi:SagB-type dehydrogenase family enzyme|nr:SagB/ThcOx family dehydrogenase [Chitinispirillales bacterium]